MFLNDHISIDNLLIDVERSLFNLAHLRNNLYEIQEIEDYKQLRGDLSQFLFGLESDIQTVLNSLIQIQEVNRKYYDTFAILKNNETEMNQHLIYFERENNLLQEKLIDYKKQNDYLISINTNQEKYINELIGKLSCKEKREYGCQLTRNPFTNSCYSVNSVKSFNYDYNNGDGHKQICTQEAEENNIPNHNIIRTNSDKVKINCNKEEDYQLSKSSLCKNNTDNKEENNSKNNDSLHSNEINQTDALNPSIKKQNNNNNKSEFQLKEKIEQLYNSIHTKENKESINDNKSIGNKNISSCKDKDESNKDNSKSNQNNISSSTQIKEINKSEEAFNKKRIQTIIKQVFKNEDLLSQLKAQFGNDYIDKITISNVNEQFIFESEMAITEYDKAKQIRLQNTKHNNDSTLKNYFMHNLLQEKMLSNSNIKKKEQD